MNLSTLMELPQPLKEDVERASLINSLCKTPQAHSASRRQYRDLRLEIIPGIYSDDPRIPGFLKRVCDFELKEGRSDVTGFYFGPYPGAALSKARSKAGSSILPLSYSEKRGKGYDRVDENLVLGIRSLMRVVTKHRVDTFGRISTGSGVGFPYCVSDLELKKRLMLKALRNLKRVFELVRKKDLESLYEEFDILFLSNTQIRRQCDAYNKRRDILLFENTPDRPSVIHDIRPKNPLLEEQRTRVVYAFSWVANILGTIFGDGYRSYMDLAFEQTFKHRGPDHVISKLSKVMNENGESFRAYGLDFSRYDTTIPECALLAFIESFPVPDEIRQMMMWQIYAPHYSSDDGRGKPLLDGNPLLLDDFNFYRGLSSGVWFTSMAGKVVAVGMLLGRLKELGLLRVGRDGLISEADVRGFLRHKHPIVKVYCLNQSDDTILFGDREQVLSLFKKVELSKTFKVEKEPTVIFLGYIYYIDENTRKIRYQLSLSSYLIGMWVPERSIDDPHFRPYGVMGLQLRENVEIYGSNCQFREFREFHDRCFLEHFDMDFRKILDANLKLPMIDLDSIADDLPLAAELISDPSKALWKFNETDLGPYSKLLEKFSSAILPEVVLPFINHMMRNDLISKENLKGVENA